MGRAIGKKCNKILYSRVQRLMDIKIAKVYRTTSDEALCILTGTPKQKRPNNNNDTDSRITLDSLKNTKKS